jgi:hypothetical protein
MREETVKEIVLSTIKENTDLSTLEKLSLINVPERFSSNKYVSRNIDFYLDSYNDYLKVSRLTYKGGGVMGVNTMNPLLARQKALMDTYKLLFSERGVKTSNWSLFTSKR